MQIGVYEDGDLIKMIDLDINDKKAVESTLTEEFDYDEEEDGEYEYEVGEEEVYIAVNECQYLWVEKHQ